MWKRKGFVGKIFSCTVNLILLNLLCNDYFKNKKITLMGKMCFAVIVTKINLIHNVIKEKNKETYISNIYKK